MLDFLFRRLTAEPERAAELFQSIVAAARARHWYTQGEVPDDLTGRFRALATCTAIVLVRLELDGEPGDLVSVALTERFITVMEAEHRELGLGDPTLGKTVRKLVGSLARRVGLWRDAASGRTDWPAAVLASLYSFAPSAAALDHSAEATKALWTHLQALTLTQIEEGSVQ